MRKITTLIVMLVLCAASLFAQAPEKFTYQAVVRNANNTLVANAQVGVRVNILQGTATGNAVYSETHMVSSNANGLVTLNIGAGSVLHGSFANIDWDDGPYFLKTDIDPNGGNDYNITSTQQLLSVPYALYAKEAANSFSGDYNDLTNTPQIPMVPTNVSAFSNDAGYITSYSETDPVFNAWDKNYNDLTNRPQIPTVPTNVSSFTNDAGYITTMQVPAAQVNADWTAVSGAAQILNKPTLFSGNYSDLVGKPTNLSQFNNDLGLATVATSGSYNDLNYRPNLATVATTGNYNDLSNRPTIPTVPTNVSAFTNDAGYVTSADVQQAAGVPTNVSAFNNDMGYLTSYTETDPLFSAWGKNYNTLVNKPNLAAVATSGNYNDLTNKPTIPTVPANVSVFNNDAHYITEAQLNALLASMNSTIDSLRDRVEELENGGTPVNPNPSIPDTTSPVIPIIVDGQACPGNETITDVDGNIYPTVVIGQQCWMKTNLRTTHYSDGTIIELSASTSSTDPRRYYPGGNSNNLNTYGYLYNWYAVMNGNESSYVNPSMVQGVCPEGWHVPSNSEWSQLRNYVNSYAGFRCSGTNEYIAKALCSPERWNSTANTPCAVGYTPSANNNATGFTALPAGTINDALAPSYNAGVGNYACFWSCTQSNTSKAYFIKLEYNSPTVGVYGDGAMSKLFSVRCVCDNAITGGGAQAVVTGFVNNVTSTTAQCGGSVVTDNGYSVTERGVCWSTSNPPMVYHNRTIDGAGMGSFVSSLTGLIPGTTYYVRAYAITNAGTIYGGVVSFTTPTLCGTSTIFDYDLNEYPTVQIGNQCWLKENLRSTHYADGTAISSVNNVSSSSTAYYYAPSGSIGNGYLYNWKAVMRSSSSSSANPSGIQGICPTGWHVPSDQEWAELENFVGSQDSCLCSSNQTYIAKALAANSGWTSNTGTCVVGNGQNNNNKTGFSALPVGCFYYGNGGYHSIGTGAYFWSATQTSTDNAWYRSLQNNSASVSRSSASKDAYGYSVRCLRD